MTLNMLVQLDLTQAEIRALLDYLDSSELPTILHNFRAHLHLGPCLTKYFVFSLDGLIAVLTYDFIVQLVYFLVIQSHGEVVYKLVPIPVTPILLSTYLL